MNSTEVDKDMVFALVRRLVALEPGCAAGVIAALTEGQALHIGALNERLSKANDALVAAVMLTNDRATPALKDHLELTLLRHLEPGIERDCNANKTFVSRVKAKAEGRT